MSKQVMIGDPVHPRPLRPPQVTVVSVAYDDPAAAALRRTMTYELAGRYVGRDDELAAHTETLRVRPATIAYTALAVTGDGLPIGHLALRRAGEDLELKRMYVIPAYRGGGVAVALLKAAEDAARRLGVTRIILQTGDRQPEAVRLYERQGYRPIPVFPPYEELWFSRCYAKALK